MELLKTKRYPAYKDSGIKWLGEVPEHWIMRKGKWLFFKQERPVRKDDKIVTCFRDGQVTLRKNRKTEGFTNALKEHGYQGIRKGDLVIHCMDAFAGAIGVSDSDGKSTPVYSVCTSRINGVNLYYYSYFLRNLAKKGFIESLAKGIRERSTDFRFNDLGVLLLPFPPLVEQKSIAEYLDKKTEQIDKAIAQKEQMIELLKERKQILINRAVTRGLNPDTPLKDSGIDWVGQIPAHWEVIRLKYLFHRVIGGVWGEDRKNNSNDLVCIRVADFSFDQMLIDTNNLTIRNIKDSEQNNRILRRGDILIEKSGGGDKTPIGRAIVFNLKIEAVCSNFINRLEPKNKEISYFLMYLLKANYLRGSINKYINQTTGIQNLNNEQFLNQFIPLPRSDEQKEIVSYIERNSEKIDKAIFQKQEEIVKLKEYKSTLIDSAVTGKICLMN